MLKFSDNQYNPRELVLGPARDEREKLFNEFTQFGDKLRKEYSILPSNQKHAEDAKTQTKKADYRDITIKIDKGPKKVYRYKIAEPTGTASAPQFEEAFQRLAYEYIRGQAPGLMPYVMGFQVLQTNDDKTKAVGVYGYKVGNEWLYTPVFFLNGNLKGHELLFISGEKRFVPLNENWVGEILRKESIEAGHGENRSISSLNVRVPDMLQLTRPPRYYKMGEARQEFIDNLNDNKYLASLRYADIDKMAKFASLDSEYSLENFLNKSEELCAALTGWMASDPLVKHAYYKLHKTDILKEALNYHLTKYASSSSKLDFDYLSNKFIPTPDFVLGKKKPKSDGVTVVIKTPNFKDQLNTYTDTQRVELATKGYTVLDKRQKDSVSTIVRKGSLNIQTPTTPGLYDVLMSDGSTRHCAIIPGIVPNRGTNIFSLIIDTESKEYLVAKEKDILTIGGVNFKNCYYDWWNSLKDDTSISDGYNETFNVILSSRGAATIPFSADNIGDGTFSVNFNRFMDNKYEVFRDCSRGYCDETRNEGDIWLSHEAPKKINVDANPTDKFYETAQTLYAPKNRKIIKVKEAKKDFVLGTFTLVSALTSKTASQLAVKKQAGLYRIDRHEPCSKPKAVAKLIVDYNFQQKDAEDILSKANSYEKIIQFINPSRLKSAEIVPEGSDGTLTSDYGVIEQGQTEPVRYSDPLVPDATLQTNMLNVNQVQGERALDYNPDGRMNFPLIAPDPLEKQQIMQAASQGKSKVFDTHVLDTLLSHCDDDVLIQDAIPVLEKALDRLGTLLMQLYWRHDTFENRFGKVDTPDLENNLINSFKALGDICIFLRQKNVAPTSHLLFNSSLLDNNQ